jgi:endonuclease/exonuclease/phosphatase family metal-dependent hydrolase
MLYRVVIILSLVLFSNGAISQPLRVMTYNIRFDNPGDSVNAWPNRKDKVFTLISKYDPDILGIQEALHHQITDITGNLKHYIYIGVGRDDGKEKGEYSPILFRKKRFKVIDQSTFWLSLHPEIPGSKDWDAAITRVATWAIMKDRVTKRKFFILNTHFDHIGKEARKQSAEIIKRKILELAKGLPVIVTGDFNSTREEPPYMEMINGTQVALNDPAKERKGTFCTFKVNGAECRAIDYIFITNEWKSESYLIIDDHDGKYYPSDHLPVITTLQLSK